MNAMTKRALLFVPILVLAGLALVHEYRRSTGTVWTIPVAGYDPRDMLRGHYLQYQYEWNLTGPRACSGEDCALCTDEPERFNPPVRLVPRAEAGACASFIAVSANRVEFGFDNGIYIAGARDNLTRYYVPESDALRLETLLRQDEGPAFSVGLRVTDSGTAYIEAMYVDGVPLETWLRQ
jgi:uncharacterized membrane-anchored protein